MRRARYEDAAPRHVKAALHHGKTAAHPVTTAAHPTWPAAYHSSPGAGARGALVDLLDRVLERGLVLDADVLITLSGVPLVGLKLRAALAGAQTLLRYGLMQDWLQPLAPGEARGCHGSSRGCSAGGAGAG